MAQVRTGPLPSGLEGPPSNPETKPLISIFRGENPGPTGESLTPAPPCLVSQQSDLLTHLPHQEPVTPRLTTTPPSVKTLKPTSRTPPWPQIGLPPGRQRLSGPQPGGGPNYHLTRKSQGITATLTWGPSGVTAGSDGLLLLTAPRTGICSLGHGVAGSAQGLGAEMGTGRRQSMRSRGWEALAGERRPLPPPEAEVSWGMQSCRHPLNLPACDPTPIQSSLSLSLADTL